MAQELELGGGVGGCWFWTAGCGFVVGGRWEEGRGVVGYGVCGAGCASSICGGWHGGGGVEVPGDSGEVRGIGY